MKLSEFKFRVKAQTPNIGVSGATDQQICDLLNQACDQINLLTKVYKGTTGGYTDFAVVADQQIYSLSSIAPTYLGMGKEGLYFKDSNGEWISIIPKTKAWIDERFPGWLNASSVDVPTYYWVDGDELGFYPAPNTSLSAGARIYHLKKCTPMDNDDNYPWTNLTTELTALRAMDDAIIAYARWKLSPAIGANFDSDLTYREYMIEVQKGVRLIRRRPDLTIDSDYVMRS